MSRRFKNYRLKDSNSSDPNSEQQNSDYGGNSPVDLSQQPNIKSKFKDFGIASDASEQEVFENTIKPDSPTADASEQEFFENNIKPNSPTADASEQTFIENEYEAMKKNEETEPKKRIEMMIKSEDDEKGIELPAPDSSFEEILIVKDIVKIYNKNKENEVYALKGLSFSVKKGEMVSIMGPSGSGKSTLLHLLGALDSPTSGEIFIGNRSISKMSESELTKFRRMQVGFVFQYYNLIPTLSALENVELPMVLAGVPKKQRIEQANYMLELVGLKERMNNKPNQMSGGQMQRVAIARALANHPSIVLADEPTGNLDTKTGEEIMELFKKLNREYNQTFIIVTHDQKIADYTEKTFHILDGLLDRIEIRQSRSKSIIKN